MILGDIWRTSNPTVPTNITTKATLPHSSHWKQICFLHPKWPMICSLPCPTPSSCPWARQGVIGFMEWTKYNVGTTRHGKMHENPPPTPIGTIYFGQDCKCWTFCPGFRAWSHLLATRFTQKNLLPLCSLPLARDQLQTLNLGSITTLKSQIPLRSSCRKNSTNLL
jgi:hypothetical protein